MTEKKKKKKARIIVRKDEFSKQELDVVRARAQGKTLLECAEAAGLGGNDKSKQSYASHLLANVREKTNNNPRLQELLNLRGAGLEKIAEVFADGLSACQPVVVRDTEYVPDANGKVRKVSTARIEYAPDHRVRVDTAKHAAFLQNAEPEKKVVVEQRSYEEKISLIAEIKQNPAEAIANIQALLERKLTQGGEL